MRGDCEVTESRPSGLHRQTAFRDFPRASILLLVLQWSWLSPLNQGHEYRPGCETGRAARSRQRSNSIRADPFFLVHQNRAFDHERKAVLAGW